jgi:hypothetical protein
VTCAPPWSFDPACGTSSRTDEATRFHDRPCLNEPFGAVDHAVDAGGSVRVTGWAVANSDYQQSGIRVFVDDKVVHHGVADRERLDVRWAYPAFPPNTGFDVTVKAPPGKRLICVWGVDRRTGRTALLAAREVVVTGPFGRLEEAVPVAGGIRVTGWTLANPRRESARVQIFLDTAFVRDSATDQPRPDVQRLYPSAVLNSGYRITVPASPGKHLVCAWGLDPRTGAQTLLGAKELTVPS